ncbi:MAG: PD-(D/E)XK nuclease family protein [Desulfurococcales archaeon]|nr:PD-(D/E)XK nuclease family protein [Desulfurococcales archaeon]
MITAATVYGWFRDLIKERRVSDPKVIHVSEAANCLRRAYYDRVSPAPKLDIVNVVALIGNGVHYQLQQYLGSRGWRAEVECKYETKKVTLVGHADLISPEGEIVELKTCNQVPSRPWPNHVLQLNAYLTMLKASKGYIIYVARGGKVRVFEVKPKRGLFDRLVRRAYHLHYCLIEKREPRPEKGPLCDYCPYRWRCCGGEKK